MHPPPQDVFFSPIEMYHSVTSAYAKTNLKSRFTVVLLQRNQKKMHEASPLEHDHFNSAFAPVHLFTVLQCCPYNVPLCLTRTKKT